MSRKKARRASRHHLVPSFYLAGFTLENSQQGRLYVFDELQRQRRVSKPRETAIQRDFYAVFRIPGLPVDGVESALANCEQQWAPAVREVTSKHSFVSDEIYTSVMAFVAFQIARIPRYRTAVEEFL